MRKTEWMNIMFLGLVNYSDFGNNGKLTQLEYTKLRQSIFQPINVEQMNSLTRQRTNNKVSGNKILEN